MKKIGNFLPVEIGAMLTVNIILSWLLKYYVEIPFLLTFFLIFTGYIFNKLRKNEKTRKLANLSLTVIIFVLIYNGVTSFFPLSSGKIFYANKNADMYLSKKIADSIKTKEKDIFENYKDKILDGKLVEYEKLLDNNEPEKAAKIMAQLRDKWDYDKITERIEAEKKRISDSIALTKVREQGLPQNNSATVSQNIFGKVGGLYKVGSHLMPMKNGEISDWCTIEDCHNYGFTKGSSRFSLIYQDGSRANSWEPGKWPDKKVFRIMKLNDGMIQLNVI